MARGFKELVKDINFDLKLLECMVCLLGLILSLANVSCFSASYFWFVHGWFIVSLAFVVAYISEQPNFGMEVIILITFSMPMIQELIKSSCIDNLCPVITVILMNVDLYYLITNRPR